MKKILAIIIILISVTITPITAYASDYADEWLAQQKAKDEQWMNELEADGNLTQEAIDSVSKGKSTRKPSAKQTAKSKNSKSTQTQSTTDYGKGWVYSTDELHVVGLPEDSETGYTKSGWYGNVD